MYTHTIHTHVCCPSLIEERRRRTFDSADPPRLHKHTLRSAAVVALEFRRLKDFRPQSNSSAFCASLSTS